MSETFEAPAAPPSVQPAPEPVRTEGWLELSPDGSGHLRRPTNNYLPVPGDVYVPAGLVQKSFLRPGDLVVGLLAPGDQPPPTQQVGAGAQGAAVGWSGSQEFRQGGGGRRRRRRRGPGGGGGGNGQMQGGQSGMPRPRGPALNQVLQVNGQDPA